MLKQLYFNYISNYIFTFIEKNVLWKNENHNLSQVFFNISNSLCIFYPAILHLDSNFTSTHYQPLISIYSLHTCARKVACVYCIWLVQTACVWQHSGLVILHIHYIHDTHACGVRLCALLHDTMFGMPLRLSVQCQLNKKLLIYQQLIIVYLIVLLL